MFSMNELSISYDEYEKRKQLIREIRADGYPVAAIAEMFGLCRMTVYGYTRDVQVRKQPKMHPPKRKPKEYRFLSNLLIDDGCWIYTGNKGTFGYGRFCKQYAHRYSYEYFNGPIPDGLFVCHACDNPACVNPSHLWLGTAADNMHDRDAKGRGRTRPHPLTKTERLAVAAAHAAGEKTSVICQRYSISSATVYRVCAQAPG